jgi:hypothetical protein
VSFTAAEHDPAQTYWDVRVTPYYSYVQDYIDVDRGASAGCLTSLPTNFTATSDFVFLRFANHDDALYSVNIEGKLALWNNSDYGRGDLRGSLSYVDGERTDGIGLYHLMPINAKISIDHALGNWSSSLELQLVGAKNRINEVHNELTTPAYTLVNFRTGYQWQAVRADVGIDNLFNQYYLLPLGGADLSDYRVTSMIGTTPAYGYGVAGPGRSFNGRLTVKFRRRRERWPRPALPPREENSEAWLLSTPTAGDARLFIKKYSGPVGKTASRIRGYDREAMPDSRSARRPRCHATTGGSDAMINAIRPLIVANTSSSYAFEAKNTDSENATFHFRFLKRDQERDSGLLQLIHPVSPRSCIQHSQLAASRGTLRNLSNGPISFSHRHRTASEMRPDRWSSAHPSDLHKSSSYPGFSLSDP